MLAYQPVFYYGLNRVGVRDLEEYYYGLSAIISQQVVLHYNNIVLLRYNKWKVSENIRQLDNWIKLIHVYVRSGKSSVNRTVTDMHLNTTGSYR